MAELAEETDDVEGATTGGTVVAPITRDDMSHSSLYECSASLQYLGGVVASKGGLISPEGF